MAKRSVSRAQTPSHRPKRRSSAILDAPCPCSAAQTPSWSANLSWGTKRGRTTRPDRSSERRDWANLGDGPAGVIAELVLANDVADYVRFRAVCRAWRRCSPDPRLQHCFGDSRYHPRQWIMLDKVAAPHPRCRRFLNLTTGECVRMDLPELDEHALLALTPEGLILLLHEPSRAVRLLNPLTRQLINLPPVTTLPTLELPNLEKTIKVEGAGIVDASMVAVSFGCPEVFVVAKPGDERWALVDSKSRFRSVLPFAGRFYCATRRGVEVLNASTDQQETPRVLTVIDWGGSLHVFEMMNDSIHLVDNAGDLMLVHRMLRCTAIDTFERRWAVYKVDLDAGVLVPAKSLGGRAVFVGFFRSASVLVDDFHIASDTLYFGYDCGGDASYNLVSAEATYYRDLIMEPCDCDETGEPCNHNMDFDWQGPGDIVSCLCDCIQGVGKELV